MPINTQGMMADKERWEKKMVGMAGAKGKLLSVGPHSPIPSARTKRRATAKLTRQKEALAEALEIVQDDRRHAEMMKRMEFINKELERNECD